jgi:hypothetical protein
MMGIAVILVWAMATFILMRRVGASWLEAVGATVGITSLVVLLAALAIGLDLAIAAFNNWWAA